MKLAQDLEESWAFLSTFVPLKKSTLVPSTKADFLDDKDCPLAVKLEA